MVHSNSNSNSHAENKRYLRNGKLANTNKKSPYLEIPRDKEKPGVYIGMNGDADGYENNNGSEAYYVNCCSKLEEGHVVENEVEDTYHLSAGYLDDTIHEILPCFELNQSSSPHQLIRQQPSSPYSKKNADFSYL